MTNFCQEIGVPRRGAPGRVGRLPNRNEEEGGDYSFDVGKRGLWPGDWVKEARGREEVNPFDENQGSKDFFSK